MGLGGGSPDPTNVNNTSGGGIHEGPEISISIIDAPQPSSSSSGNSSVSKVVGIERKELISIAIRNYLLIKLDQSIHSIWRKLE